MTVLHSNVKVVLKGKKDTKKYVPAFLFLFIFKLWLLGIMAQSQLRPLENVLPI